MSVGAAETSAAEDEGVEPVICRQAKLEDSDMDITPMIDMTFLLLIFFIVTSRMTEDAGVNLPQARHGAIVATKDAIVLIVAPGDDFAQVSIKEEGSGEAKFRQISGGNLEEQEDAIASAVEAVFAADPKKTTVLIQAEKGLKHREVARVARAAARAEIEQLYVGVMEKK